MGQVKEHMYECCIKAAASTAPKTMVDLHNATDFIFNRWIEADPKNCFGQYSTFDGIAFQDHDRDDLRDMTELYVSLANAYFKY